MHTKQSVAASLPATLGNQLLLLQGLELLAGLSSHAFAHGPDGHSPVGTQLRHVLDHYEAFFEGLPSGRVDYDARRRDGLLESRVDLAAAALVRWHEALGGLDATSADASLLVQSDSGAGGDAPDWRPSSVGRELQFLASHTTHHFALIALLLELQGLAPPAGFGVAPSTRAFLATR
jgi:hypothetical protein